MSKKLTIESVLFPSDSKLGRDKTDFFKSSRIICPKIPDASPSYRFTWEKMCDEVTMIPKRAIAAMGKSKNGDAIVAAYKALPTRSVVQSFLDEITTRMLPAGFPEYNPAFGFDLEAFIVIGPPRGEVVIIEIFPRAIKGDPASAFGSLLRSEHALANLREPEHFKELLIGKFTVGESLDESEQQEAKKRLHAWIQDRGFLHLEDAERIGLFLNTVTLSFLQEATGGQKTVSVGSAGKIIGGERTAGSIVLTSSNN